MKYKVTLRCCRHFNIVSCSLLLHKLTYVLENRVVVFMKSSILYFVITQPFQFSSDVQI